MPRKPAPSKPTTATGLQGMMTTPMVSNEDSQKLMLRRRDVRRRLEDLQQLREQASLERELW